MTGPGDRRPGADPGIERLPDAVFGVDADLYVTAANDQAARLSGYASHELAGLAVGRLLHWRDAEGRVRDLDGWPRSARLPTVRALPEQTLRLRRADGADLAVAVTAAYQRDKSGSLLGAWLCVRQAGRRAPAAVSGIEIVSTVSHELRSPLTSVKGYTSLLLNRWDRLKDDQKRMMLEQVHHDADRVTRLITELLDISRLETGRLILRRQMVDLPRLTSTVVDKVGFEYPSLEASVAFPDPFPKVYADPDKVEQVLTNLVENACKYASPQDLCIQAAVGPGHVTVAVTDRGEGIPESDLPKVFTKFFRRSEGKPTGSGLGLWISRGLVESHGGELVADSILGQGSTFRFTLPLVDIDTQETRG